MDLYSPFFIYRVAGHRKWISAFSVITRFSATLIGLKTPQNDEGRQHAVQTRFHVKYSKEY